MTPPTDDPNTLLITRQFKADRSRVFAAFASFEMMSRWFGPAGCEVTGGSLDFRVGGGYQIRINSPYGEMVAGGAYTEITPPDKLVFTWRWEGDEDWANVESVVTFEFLAKGDETELRMTHVGFPSLESRGNHQKGWDGAFVNLDALLAA